MLPAAGKGERRNRGSARLSSKMSGRPPRLRILRPRQPQQQAKSSGFADFSVADEASCSPEGNLKEAASERVADAKRRDARAADAKAANNTKTVASAMASEMDDDDDDNNDDGLMAADKDVRQPLRNVEFVTRRTEEVIDLEPNERNSYDCKSNPTKVLPDMKDYFRHPQKEHKHKGKSGHSPVENRCPACSYVALNVKDLENHQRVHHLKRRFFRCAKCSYVTHVRARYTKHVKYHSMPMIKCDACDFRTPYKWNLDRHTRNHGGAGAFQCRVCNFTADIRQSLTVHETNHHDPPMGQTNRKSNNPFERKLRNSPKRYNQVGASDFRETLNKSVASSISETFVSDSSIILVDDKRSAIASAECIALKCEEKGCQFITAWDSEMQRHLAECHAPVIPSKPRKPLPMLIPLSTPNSRPISSAPNSGPPTTLLKVPRVRVRPELAQIARDTELAKMYGNKEATNSKKDLNTAAGIFERKNASFFDKLKEKLTTATSINNGVPEVAVEQQTWDEDHMEERSVGETSVNEPPTKVLILNNKEYIPSASQVTNPVTILPSTDSSRNSSHNMDLSLRPPPPLKAAIRARGQSLLKNNPITMSVQNISGTSGGAVTISSTIAADESKRTQWKCKRCNYRDSNKDNVLLHVKSHYESTDQESTEERNPFGCGDCPFSAPDAATLSLHRMHHRPNLEAIFKCYRCPYYVSTKAELLEHARLHGEELAAVHQQSTDLQVPNSKMQQVLTSNSGTSQTKNEASIEQVIQITTRNSVTSMSNTSKAAGGPPPPPLLLDTRSLPEAPLVWVTRPDGTLMKMLKCRHCPYVSSRRAEVQDHEAMHASTEESVIPCTDCSFTCSHRDVMIAHTDMHAGCLGTVHCLVDESRPDSQQLSDLSTLLGLSHSPVLGAEPDLQDSRLVHCCDKCPARFLCEKELRIHLRYHTTDLAYSCQWCSYAARQPSHLLAHQKAHSSEYQERTKYLLSVYNHSQRFPPPATACVEAENQESNDSELSNVAWIVVEVNESVSSSYNSDNGASASQRTNNQVFTCAKCPARYFKLDALEYHMTLHGSNNRYKCNDCDYSSKTAQNLVKHQVVHRRHNEASETSAVSPTANVSITATASATASPLQNMSPDPQFGLFMRGNPNFVYPGYLRNGRLKEKRYKCHKCPSAFEKREQYRVHLTLHGAKQRYRCETCDYSVKYYANYAQHQKKHLANAEAQASRRQFEDDRISVEHEGDVMAPTPRSGKSLRSTGAVHSLMMNPSAAANNGAFSVVCNNNVAALQPSNQDKQSLLLMQKKGIISSTGEIEPETIRCQSCPFSTTDKETMDAHKRRHGIERMTPPCPHCDYVPRKDENVGEHIRLHFTRLYKPESYLIVELLTLMMEKTPTNGKEEKQQCAKELLFKECSDGRFMPLAESLNSHSSLNASSSTINVLKEKVIVDPNTGETKHLTV
ncbi:uncharacterized protein LOC105181057 isoform X6 [Harpegnathos saltator]|uniref:uncharacterized protein LOC105181057 isoform X6 n=1 Tax=Harpegnathos saltator TaxID=610380 RepID=UPI000DBEE576|nr:uncharacterized protein LOC105181057 isoform X6 [Harpegnathos saltator]